MVGFQLKIMLYFDIIIVITPSNLFYFSGAHHKIARQFKLSNRFAIFTPGLFHRIYIHLGIKFTGCHVSFWKGGFELKVAIPQNDDILGYDLQIIFQCFNEKKFFNVYIFCVGSAERSAEKAPTEGGLNLGGGRGSATKLSSV